MGSAHSRRSVALVAGAVAMVVVAGLLAALLWAPWPRQAALLEPPGAGGPDPDAAIRDRLGGLAGLLIGDDPLLRACADPTAVTGRAPEPSAPVRTSPVAGRTDPVVAVTARTEALRGRELRQPPEVRLLVGAEMTEQVAGFFAGRGDSAQIDIDTRALTALGAIAPGTDLAELRLDAFAEQVSGYHLGSEGVIGIRVRTRTGLTPLERLEHALSYQHVGRPGEHREGEASADASRAGSALVEGSAAVAMLQYAHTVLTRPEQLTLRDELSVRAGRRALAGYSPYLLAELRFPYLAGLRYTCQRWLDGGWAAVEAGYRDPPASTAAVLFPDRHGEQPRQPAALAAPGRSWRHAETASFGAAELEWLLAAPGGDRDAGLDRVRERVSAWDGGRRTVWTDRAASAVGLALVDRAAPGTPPLCGTLQEWYAAAFPLATVERDGNRIRFDGRRQDAVLACPGPQVRVGIAPTLEQATAIVG